MSDNVGRAMPSGVVTFLFTDIEGSTRRWEADPEVMRSALANHDDVLQRAVETHQGRVFKHTGDGVCAVFTSPKAAVEAAVAAQQALELPVRMGIATGEAELRGSDYFGAVLNRAARTHTNCYGGAYSSSCTYYPGGWIEEYDTDDEIYVVTPDTVLPDEPGHLP
jgi:class 3 adenylate cyclase